MAVVVNTNVSSLIAQRNLTSAQNAMNTSMKRMSTGVKINSAADDAAGLYVAKGLETQIRGSQQAVQNVEVGVNVLQTAEGDLSTIQDNLLRIKDLMIQAANDYYSTDAKTAIRNEVEQRMNEINRLSSASNFNGIYLLNGSIPSTGLRLQIGAGSATFENSITVKGVFSSASCGALGMITGTGTGAAAITTTLDGVFANTSSCAAFIANCDAAITNITTKRADLGVAQNRMTSASSSLAITIENLTASKSTIMDTDVAAESSNYTKAQILQQSTAALLVQANSLPQVALQLIGG